jgi:hypothetical protein
MIIVKIRYYLQMQYIWKKTMQMWCIKYNLTSLGDLSQGHSQGICVDPSERGFQWSPRSWAIWGTRSGAGSGSCSGTNTRANARPKTRRDLIKFFDIRFFIDLVGTDTKWWIILRALFRNNGGTSWLNASGLSWLHDDVPFVV